MSDLFEIVVLAAGAHALLAGGGPDVVALLLTQEGALELHHPRVGKQQCRIVGGRQRRRRHLTVPLGDEEVEKQTPDCAGLHGGNIERLFAMSY
jgi:hypothetical protein